VPGCGRAASRRGRRFLVEDGGAGLARGVVVAGGGQFAQAGVPVGYEGVGDQPVSGIDCQVAAPCLVGCALGALDVGGAQGVGVPGLGGELVGDGERDLQGQRGEGGQQQAGDGCVEGAPGRCWQIGAALLMPSFWQT
jgi:hypothetical protein